MQSLEIYTFETESEKGCSVIHIALPKISKTHFYQGQYSYFYITQHTRKINTW